MLGGVKPCRMDNPAAPTPHPSGVWRLEAHRYPAIFAARRTIAGRTIVMWISRSDDAGRKAGVVVSKRVLKRAVDRNRAKRLMREAFRLRRHLLAPDVEVVLTARSTILGKQCAEVAADLERLFKRAKVLAP